MGNDLILFDNNFNLKNNSILNYIYSNTIYQKKTDLELFICCITDLYRMPVFVPLLNAIITKLKHKQAEFKILPLKSWDRVLGHCTTATKEIKDQESIFKNRLFSKHYTIVIKKIIPDIIIHEIGHSIEHISKIDINKDFKNALSKDLKFNNSNSIELKNAVKIIMQDELKNYKLESYMAELFARFFELIAISKESGGWGRFKFHYNEILNYFTNTIDWTNNILIPILKKETDDEINRLSIDFINNIGPYKKEWTKNIKSKFANVNDMNNKWVESLITNNENEEIIKEADKFFKEKDLKKLDNGVEYFEFKKK